MRLTSIAIASLLLATMIPLASAESGEPNANEELPCSFILQGEYFPYVWISESCLNEWIAYILQLVPAPELP